MNCSLDDNIQNHEYDVDENDKKEVDWFYISVAIGFTLSFWVVCGSLLFNKSQRHAYFLFLDHSCKILLAKLSICWEKYLRILLSSKVKLCAYNISHVRNPPSHFVFKDLDIYFSMTSSNECFLRCSSNVISFIVLIFFFQLQSYEIYI